MLDADLLARIDIIVQQCNCLTVRAHGLSADIAEKLGSYANPYAKRINTASPKKLADEGARGTPGRFEMCVPPNSDNKLPMVACLFGQWAPGSIHAKSLLHQYPRPPHSDTIETVDMRIQWFRAALIDFRDAIMQTDRPGRLHIAIPWKIGCGLAGGNWATYEQILNEELGTLARLHDIVLYRKHV